jgi:Tfp pilus assembly protein PilF
MKMLYPPKLFSWTATALLSALIFLSLQAQAYPRITPPTSVDEYAFDDPDMFALPEELKTLLDTEIKPVRLSAERAIALHELLFKEHELNIQYNSRRTFTAAQTYQYRQGNCLSLAALYVAAAKHVGLRTVFQSIEIPPNWERREAYYFVPGHVNVMVKTRREDITIEFIQTFANNETKNFKKNAISFDHILADYHNNIGMEYLDEGNRDKAFAHLNKSINHYPKLDYVWSNLGVLYKYKEDLDSAESMYLKALKLNKKNFSAITNLYILYKQTEQLEQAEKLAKKVQRYHRKNPYHIIRMAEINMQSGDYVNARKLIKKALRKDKEKAEFYKLLGQTEYKLGNFKDAAEAMLLARKYAPTANDWKRYNKKLTVLAALYGQTPEQ